MSDTKFVPPPNQNFLALPVDTVIGRYRITGILGQGSFGITYRAHDGQLGRDVAIKEYLPTSFAFRHDGLTVLPNSTAAAEDFAWGRQRFVEEGRTLAGFQRAPGIVRVHDFLEANGTAYIVMELATGETLGARLQRQGRLAAAEVERILRALLDGLEKVHAASFIHRDIKPDNILLDDEGQPTLIDFGAARAAVAGRTAALTGIFTPGYAAIEQFTDGRQGPFTDIYALSATLYQSITGEKPPSAIDRVLEDKYVPLAKRRPAGFAPALLAGIDRGMAIRPEARPQTIAAWRALLFPGETREKPIAAQRREPTRWRVAAIAGLAVVLARRSSGPCCFLLEPPKAPVADADRLQAESRAADAAADREAAGRAGDATSATASPPRSSRPKKKPRRPRRRRPPEAAAEKRSAASSRRHLAADADARGAATGRASRPPRCRGRTTEGRRGRPGGSGGRGGATPGSRGRTARSRAAAGRAGLAEKEAREKAIAEDNARNAEADAEKAKADAGSRPQGGGSGRGRVASRRCRPPADPGGAHRTGLRHARHRWRVRPSLARDGRGLANRAQLAGDRVPRRRPAAETGQRLGGGGREVRRRAEEGGRRRGPAQGAGTAGRHDGHGRPVAPRPRRDPSAFAGRWNLVRSKCIPSTPQRFFGVTVEGNRFTYGFTFANRSASCTVAIRPDGSFGSTAARPQCRAGSAATG